MSRPVPVPNHGLFSPPFARAVMWQMFWLAQHMGTYCSMSFFCSRYGLMWNVHVSLQIRCRLLFSSSTCVYILQDLFWLLHVGLIKLVSVCCSPDHRNRDWHQRRLIWRLSLSHLAKCSTSVVEKPMWSQKECSQSMQWIHNTGPICNHCQHESWWSVYFSQFLL